MSDKNRTLQAILRTDLNAFVEKVFNTVYPGSAYLHNWHIEAIVHELMEIERGDNLRLIVNQPPRSLKTLIISIAFVAWMLGRDPSLRIAVISYSSELAAEFHRQFRLVINAAWFRQLFPGLRTAKDTSMEYITTAGGGRLAISVDGTFTGRGADLMIIDDPQKEGDTFSDVSRKRVIDWVTSTLFSRLNDKATTPIILVQQRIHEDDVTGHLLRQGGWRHLRLQAIATARESVPLGNGRFHVRLEGEPLHAARESLEILDRIRRDKGPISFSLHYQQEPVPLAGNLIRRDWFKLVDSVPERKGGVRLVQSWDIASTIGDNSDYSVCLSFVMVRGDYYLVDVWRGQLEYPDLRRMVIALAEKHRATTILIEDAGPGQNLLQDLLHSPPAGMTHPIGRKPVGSKEERMAAQSARIEAGHVYLPEDAPWLAEFLTEVLAFPTGRHDDQVDALSQFLAWAALQNRQVTIPAAPIIFWGTPLPDF